MPPPETTPPFVTEDKLIVIGITAACAFLSQVVRVRASGQVVPWSVTLWRAAASSLTAVLAAGLIDAVRPIAFLVLVSVSIGVGWVGSSLMYPLSRIALDAHGVRLPDKGGKPDA